MPKLASFRRCPPSVCDLADALWKEAWDVIGTRKRLFEELRSITRCLVFPD